MKNSDFHEWNATRRVPYNLPKDASIAVEKPVFKRKLMFGEKI